MKDLNHSTNVGRPWWQPVVFGAMACGMGWGIRGQYGHETGAMTAGLLLGLVLVLLFCPGSDSLRAARAVAWMTVAIGFGGSMTYGQTVGLTHDPALVGNREALVWGMLGLAIKGGIWIGFAGLFLGMGLGGREWRPGELLCLMLGIIGLFILGVSVINSPFDPGDKRLPFLYFSDHWRWEPGAELRPRREVWGGLLLALIGAIVYAGKVRKNRLALNMALWGCAGGAAGFPLGQSLQAFHAWHPEVFGQGVWTKLGPHINWWNMMEITFGATAGAMLGLGLWLNRRKICLPSNAMGNAMRPGVEMLLLGVHLALLITVEFASVPAVDFFYDHGLVLGLIPVVAIAGGRWWPILVVLPVTLIPIAGKTVRRLVYEEQTIGLIPGWILYGILPLLVVTYAAVRFTRLREASVGRMFLKGTLLIATWIYFGLNFAFFHFPWPWVAWTSRTPSGIIFIICAVGLTLAVLKSGSKGSAEVSASEE